MLGSGVGWGAATLECMRICGSVFLRIGSETDIGSEGTVQRCWPGRISCNYPVNILGSVAGRQPRHHSFGNEVRPFLYQRCSEDLVQ